MSKVQATRAKPFDGGKLPKSKDMTVSMEQWRIALMAGVGEKINEKELLEKVKQLSEITGCTEEIAATTLYDCSYDVERSADKIFELDCSSPSEKVATSSAANQMPDEWQVAGKDKKQRHSAQLSSYRASPDTVANIEGDPTNCGKHQNKRISKELKDAECVSVASDANEWMPGNKTPYGRGGDRSRGRSFRGARGGRASMHNSDKGDANDHFGKMDERGIGRGRGISQCDGGMQRMDMKGGSYSPGSDGGFKHVGNFLSDRLRRILMPLSRRGGNMSRPSFRGRRSQPIECQDIDEEGLRHVRRDSAASSERWDSAGDMEGHWRDETVVITNSNLKQGGEMGEITQWSDCQSYNFPQDMESQQFRDKTRLPALSQQDFSRLATEAIKRSIGVGQVKAKEETVAANPPTTTNSLAHARQALFADFSRTKPPPPSSRQLPSNAVFLATGPTNAPKLDNLNFNFGQGISLPTSDMCYTVLRDVSSDKCTADCDDSKPQSSAVMSQARSQAEPSPTSVSSYETQRYAHSGQKSVANSATSTAAISLPVSASQIENTAKQDLLSTAEGKTQVSTDGAPFIRNATYRDASFYSASNVPNLVCPPGLNASQAENTLKQKAFNQPTTLPHQSPKSMSGGTAFQSSSYSATSHREADMERSNAAHSVATSVNSTMSQFVATGQHGSPLLTTSPFSASGMSSRMMPMMASSHGLPHCSANAVQANASQVSATVHGVPVPMGVANTLYYFSNASASLYGTAEQSNAAAYGGINQMSHIATTVTYPGASIAFNATQSAHCSSDTFSQARSSYSSKSANIDESKRGNLSTSLQNRSMPQQQDLLQRGQPVMLVSSHQAASVVPPSQHQMPQHHQFVAPLAANAPEAHVYAGAVPAAHMQHGFPYLQYVHTPTTICQTISHHPPAANFMTTVQHPTTQQLAVAAAAAQGHHLNAQLMNSYAQQGFANSVTAGIPNNPAFGAASVQNRFATASVQSTEVVGVNAAARHGNLPSGMWRTN